MNDLQLSLYHMAVAQNFKDYKEIILKWYYLRSDTIVTIQHTKDRISKLENKIIQQIEKIKNDKYYTLNKVSYKKAEYLELLQPFLDSIDEYYYESKKFYLTRKQNYNSFITIIRQICRQNNINYISKTI